MKFRHWLRNSSKDTEMRSRGYMFQRTTLLGLVAAVGMVVPLAAQQSSVSPEQQKAREQLRIFESVLQGAVRNGVSAFARDHSDFIPPDIQLTATEAQVIGLAPPQAGNLVFIVQVPLIRSYILTDLLIRGPRSRGNGPLQQTANEGRGASAASRNRAAGLATADPMSVSPVVEDGHCAARVLPSRGYPDPNYEYAVAVCDALIDAMLENSAALGVKENEWLTIAAVSEPERPSAIGGTKTYLSIKGADLLAYRQGKLTKAEIRQKVDLKLG